MNIKLGQKLVIAPSHMVDLTNKRIHTPMPCKVVYINRRHKYYTVEFEFGVKESFKMEAGDTIGI